MSAARSSTTAWPIWRAAPGVVLCGAISQYNSTTGMRGPANYMSLLVNRGRMQGFLVFDFAARYGEGARAMAGWIARGQAQAPRGRRRGGDRRLRSHPQQAVRRGEPRQAGVEGLILRRVGVRGIVHELHELHERALPRGARRFPETSPPARKKRPGPQPRSRGSWIKPNRAASLAPGGVAPHSPAVDVRGADVA